MTMRRAGCRLLLSTRARSPRARMMTAFAQRTHADTSLGSHRLGEVQRGRQSLPTQTGLSAWCFRCASGKAGS